MVTRADWQKTQITKEPNSNSKSSIPAGTGLVQQPANSLPIQDSNLKQESLDSVFPVKSKTPKYHGDPTNPAHVPTSLTPHVPTEQAQISLEPVRVMQQKLVDFGKMVQALVPEYKSNADTSEHRENKHSFLDFMTQQYASKSKIQGQQFVNTDVPESTRSNTSEKNTNFTSMINSIARIGNPTAGETAPDGVWKWRTQNSLKQVYAVMHTVTEVLKDMDSPLQGYGEANLSDFAKNIGGDKEPVVSEQVSRATLLTKNIEDAERAFKDFNDLIKKDYEPIINQDKPLVSQKREEFNPREKEAMKNFGNITLTSKVNNVPVTFKPSDLKDHASIRAVLVNAKLIDPTNQSDATVTSLIPDLLNNIQTGSIHV